MPDPADPLDAHHPIVSPAPNPQPQPPQPPAHDIAELAGSQAAVAALHLPDHSPPPPPAPTYAPPPLTYLMTCAENGAKVGQGAEG